eukprot:TRINITY_DN4241_c0_g1_i1.p1 TRINITY_DN4241_c0_g1~~TRINITY_DN4241_c0_g1_i1.p1  ORF type:complete len:716 (-),score=202.99 TRINITY_DN4241_c0_g1_i1:22-1902(-)
MEELSVSLPNAHNRHTISCGEYHRNQSFVQQRLQEMIDRFYKIKKQFKQRNNLLKNWEANKQVVTYLSEKRSEEYSVEKMQQEMEVENAKIQFERFNKELKENLRSILKSKYDQFLPIYKSLLNSQTLLFKNIASSLGNVYPNPEVIQRIANSFLTRTVSPNASFVGGSEGMERKRKRTSIIQKNLNKEALMEVKTNMESNINEELLEINVPFDKPQPLSSSFKEEIKATLPPPKNQESFDNLMNMILDPDMTLVDCLVRTTTSNDTDPHASSIIKFFDVLGWSSYLLKLGIDTEVAYISAETTLFRANGVVSKMMFYFASTHNFFDFAAQVLKGPVKSLISSNPLCEIDPLKIQEGNPESNLVNLLRITLDFLKNFISNPSLCPIEIRELCNHLGNSVKKKYPNSPHVILGGFLFLRLYNPLLATCKVPNHPEIFEGIQPQHRRTLVLVSKIIQNLSNLTTAVKEEFLTVTVPFTKDNFPLIKNYFESIVKIPGQSEPKRVGTMNPEIFNNFYGKLWRSKERLIRALQLRNPEMAERFKSSMEDLGEDPFSPKWAPKLTGTIRHPSQLIGQRRSSVDPPVKSSMFPILPSHPRAPSSNDENSRRNPRESIWRAAVPSINNNICGN